MPKVRPRPGDWQSSCPFLAFSSAVRMRTRPCREISRSPEPSSSVLKRKRRQLERRQRGLALRQVATECFAARLQVADLRAVFGRLHEVETRDVIVLQRQVEVHAEAGERIRIHLLLLVRDHLAFRGLAEAEALDRVREDDRGLALVRDGELTAVKSGIDGPRASVADVVIASSRHRRGAEASRRKWARVAPPLACSSGPAVDGGSPRPPQQAIVSCASSGHSDVPTNLDDVPSGTRNAGLDSCDLAVAATPVHRDPCRLQFTDEDQVVQAIEHRPIASPRIGLVHLPSPQKPTTLRRTARGPRFPM